MNNEMKIFEFGWIDFSAADKRRVKEALAEISSGSMDELGISIIRDGFSDILFPGLSVAQTSLKYFLLIPAMLKKIERDSRSEIISIAEKDNNEGVLFRTIRSKLIKLECDFCDAACENADDKINIIGNETANKEKDGQDNSFEKRLNRFPHDIYWHGLYTFGLVDAPTMRAYISNLQSRYGRKNEKKYRPEAITEYWEKFFPFEPNDTLKSANCKTPLLLTPQEKEFLFGKIKLSTTGKNTLFEELIDNYDEYDLQSSKVESIAAVLNDSGLEEGKAAAKFSLYMRCAFLGFNIAYFYDRKEQNRVFLDEIKNLKASIGKFDLNFLDDIAAKFKYNTKKPRVFEQMKEYFTLLNGDFDNEKIKDQMIKWENAAKGAKAYLEKSNPAEKEKWIGMKYLDFRLETALKLFGDQTIKTERTQP